VKVGLARWIAIGCAMLSACELITDFERDKLDEQRTLGPTPLPTVDGAIPLMPDAAYPDGALIRPDDLETDAGPADTDAA
jgi:hypothetical protein